MARKFLTALDLNKNELQNAVLQNLASAPSTPAAGQMYYNTTDDAVYFYDGTSWIDVTDAVTLGGQAGSYYLSRANHTGTQAASTISDFDTQVRTSRLDQMAAPTASVALNSQKITGLANGTAATDAVNKGQLDAVSSGLDPKASVRVATTANITLDGPQTVDGVQLNNYDRVLVKNQTTASENGIYVVDEAGPWSRAGDADTSADVTAGMYAFVEEGTTNGDTGWVLTTNNPIVVGTTALVFVQFSGAADVTAGDGLTKTGSTLAVGAGTGISVSADAVAIDTAVVARKASANVGDGAATQIDVAHNLGTRDITVSVIEAGSPYGHVLCDVESLDANTVRLRFASAPTLNQYRVIVVG
jgi:hypothetical protein